jgi:hypothetical protein
VSEQRGAIGDRAGTCGVLLWSRAKVPEGKSGKEGVFLFCFLFFMMGENYSELVFFFFKG